MANSTLLLWLFVSLPRAACHGPRASHPRVVAVVGSAGDVPLLPPSTPRSPPLQGSLGMVSSRRRSAGMRREIGRASTAMLPELISHQEPADPNPTTAMAPTTIVTTTGLITSTLMTTTGMPTTTMLTTTGLMTTSLTTTIITTTAIMDSADNGPGFMSYTYHSPVHMVLYLSVAFLGVSCGLVSQTQAAKDENKGAWKVISSKPFSAAARILGLALMITTLLYSLPFTGYFWSGCFWSSIGGITVVTTLAAACVPQWCELCGLPPSMAKGKLGLKNAAVALLSGAGGNILIAWFNGSDECAPLFLDVSFMLIPVGLLMGGAFWQGEGGGVMGLVRRAG